MHQSTALGSFALRAAEQFERDRERYERLAVEMVEPYLPALRHLQEVQERLEKALTPMLDVYAHFNSFAEAALSDHHRMEEAVKELMKSVPVLPLEQPIFISPLRYVVADAPEEHTPAPSPIATNWEDVELRFKDTHTLTILCKGRKVRDYDYAELGFARKNTRDGRPDKQWGLLVMLSLLSSKKRAFVPTTETLSREFNVSKEALQKIKESLSKKLSNGLGIPDSPFYQYDPTFGYKTRFKILPEPILRGSGELHPSGGTYRDDLLTDDIEED